MSNTEWAQMKRGERAFLKMHHRLGAAITERCASAHAETRQQLTEIKELKEELGKTKEGFKKAEVRIDDGLRGMSRRQAGRAYKEFNHKFGDCYYALGYICMPCLRNEHEFALCAKI